MIWRQTRADREALNREQWGLLSLPARLDIDECIVRRVMKTHGMSEVEANAFIQLYGARYERQLGVESLHVGEDGDPKDAGLLPCGDDPASGD